MLRFFGRGSGFSDDHNGAYFTVGRSLVLVDCPLVTFRRLKNEGLTRFFNIANPPSRGPIRSPPTPPRPSLRSQAAHPRAGSREGIRGRSHRLRASP